MRVDSASILVCTYNRAPFLRETLAALQTLVPPEECVTEIVVVDNNSTDDTAAVVSAAAERGPMPIMYLHEPQEGRSFALNHGLSRAQGDVIAFTDDDVLPCRDWLKRIVDHFRQRDLTFVFGRVLPQWDMPPPPELLTPAAQVIWGPLAIIDYGDQPIEYERMHADQRLPIGANVAFARRAVASVGGFRTDLGRVKKKLLSGEDYEMFFRLHRRGLFRGYYDPELAVRHYVHRSRLSRRYFRRWFFWYGKTLARMLDDVFPDLDMNRVPQFGGVPRFMYRQAAEQLWRYAMALCSSDGLDRMIQELQTLSYAGLLLARWRASLWTRRAGAS